MGFQGRDCPTQAKWPLPPLWSVWTYGEDLFTLATPPPSISSQCPRCYYHYRTCIGGGTIFGKRVAPVESHQQEQTQQALREDWNSFQDHMKTKPLTVHSLINFTDYASTMLNTGCLTYALVSAQFVRKAKFQCIDLPNPNIVQGVQGTGIIPRAAHFTYDIEGWARTEWAYVVEKLNPGYDILFGRSWCDKHDITIAPAKRPIYIYSTRTRIRLRSKEGQQPPNQIALIGAAAMYKHIQDSRNGSVQIFTASMADIQKAYSASNALQEI